jgi:hypothetical protein
MRPGIEKVFYQSFGQPVIMGSITCAYIPYTRDKGTNWFD